MAVPQVSIDGVISGVNNDKPIQIGVPGLPGVDMAALHLTITKNKDGVLDSSGSNKDSTNILDMNEVLDGVGEDDSETTSTNISPNPPGGAAGSSTISDYFFRAVIIILGFIFMAIGLSMFKSPVIIQTISATKKGNKK